MIKYIVLSLCIGLIFFCSWSFIKFSKYLYVPSNKLDKLDLFQKLQVEKDTSKTYCDKELLIAKIDSDRSKYKHGSKIANFGMFTTFIVVSFQIIMFVTMLFLKKR